MAYRQYLKLLRPVWVVLIAGLFFSCGSKKSHRQMFEENLEANVSACMEPLLLKGVDSVAAESFCRCALNAAYEIDSTIVFQEDFVLIDSFSNEHFYEILEKCGHWIKDYFPEESKNSIASDENPD